MVIHFLVKRNGFSSVSANTLSSKCVVLKKCNPSFKHYGFLFELTALVFQYQYSSQAIIFRFLRLLFKNKKYVAWSLMQPGQ